MSYNYYQFIEKLGLLETTLSKTLYNHIERKLNMKIKFKIIET